MSDVIDVGEYCRCVEDHLTRANAGHLVRIVGPGFELVKQWAEAGIPLSVVFRGIDNKVERHLAGKATRPLRIEFCAADVRDVYDAWRRAVGIGADSGVAASGAAVDHGATAGSDAAPGDDGGGEAGHDRRRPSLTRHLDRAIERLARSAGRLDLPQAVREAATALVSDLVTLRERGKGIRGAAREELTLQLPPLDRQMLAVAREAAPAEVLAAVRREAEDELAPYRGRLAGDAWQRAIDALVDQRLRDRFGLPTLEM